MDIVFVDDAHQSSPFRKGMGSLVAAGAINIPTANLSSAERKLEAICKAAGFPDGQEFKWSPGKELWMKAELTGQARAEFFSSDPVAVP